VAAVEAKPELAVSKAEWLTWAKAKADWLDPTVLIKRIRFLEN
jgi:hypothetical protein